MPETVRACSKELGMTRRRRYIKPKLTIRHKIDRLSVVLDQIDPTTSNFNNLENVVRGDEKWFFMMKDGTVCRVFPDKRGEYKVPAPPRVFHKSRMPKIMFLAVCARPRPEYNFDGKIGLWSFTLERPAKRSDVRTGTVVGQTMILEDVSVTAPEYRMKIVGKDGVFDSMRRSMWWFHKSARYEVSGGVGVPCGKHVQGKWHFSKRKGTRCPEAGQPLHYQQDGARPHTAQVKCAFIKKVMNCVTSILAQNSDPLEQNYIALNSITLETCTHHTNLVWEDITLPHFIFACLLVG